MKPEPWERKQKRATEKAGITRLILLRCAPAPRGAAVLHFSTVANRSWGLRQPLNLRHSSFVMRLGSQTWGSKGTHFLVKSVLPVGPGVNPPASAPSRNSNVTSGSARAATTVPAQLCVPWAAPSAWTTHRRSVGAAPSATTIPQRLAGAAADCHHRGRPHGRPRRRRPGRRATGPRGVLPTGTMTWTTRRTARPGRG